MHHYPLFSIYSWFLCPKGHFSQNMNLTLGWPWGDLEDTIHRRSLKLIKITFACHGLCHSDHFKPNMGSLARILRILQHFKYFCQGHHWFQWDFYQKSIFFLWKYVKNVKNRCFFLRDRWFLVIDTLNIKK